MTIQLDHARFTTSREALAQRAADMTQQRHDVETAVEGLLRAWRGDAAERFRERWEEWRAGADAVIDTLHSRAHALAAVQSDLSACDLGAAEDASRLQERLG